MITEDSRYARVMLRRVVETGELFVSTRIPIVLPPAADDRHVYPRPGDRWDRMADRVWRHAFGDRAQNLWWLICDNNRVTNPLRLPDVRRRYRIPSAERIVLDVLG